MSLFFEWLSNLNKNNVQKPIISQKHAAEFKQMKQLWDFSAEENLPESPDTAGEWNRLQHAIAAAELAEKQTDKTFQHRQFFQVQRFAVAACLAGIIALSIWFGYIPNNIAVKMGKVSNQFY